MFLGCLVLSIWHEMLDSKSSKWLFFHWWYQQLPKATLSQLEERKMISDSLLASFCYHFACFSVIDVWMNLGMVFWKMFIHWGSESIQNKNDVNTLLAPFVNTFRACSARVSLKVPWLVLASIWFHFDCFGYLFGSILEQMCFLPESAKHWQTSADTPRQRFLSFLGPEWNVAVGNVDIYIYIYMIIHIYGRSLSMGGQYHQIC